MSALLLAVLIVLGFGFWFLATWPVPWAERTARGLFLAAALVWAFLMVSGGAAH